MWQGWCGRLVLLDSRGFFLGRSLLVRIRLLRGRGLHNSQRWFLESKPGCCRDEYQDQGDKKKREEYGRPHSHASTMASGPLFENSHRQAPFSFGSSMSQNSIYVAQASGDSHADTLCSQLFSVLNFPKSLSKIKRAMFSEDELFCKKQGNSFRYLRSTSSRASLVAAFIFAKSTSMPFLSRDLPRRTTSTFQLCPWRFSHFPRKHFKL